MATRGQTTELKQELECKNRQLEGHLREKEVVETSLRNILESLTVLKQELDQDAGKRTLVEHVLSGVKNLNRTISNMLLFTKCPTPRFEPVDPHHLLDASVVFASHLLVRHHHLRKIFRAERVMVRADPALLQQVFLNLILNAIQAMPEGGTLTLSTRLDRNVLEVKVSDTGIGMSPEVIEKIFDPFFSTKEGGTGLGLTIVHTIVKAHKGVIHVVSIPGNGTTVTVSLPLEPATSELFRWEAYEVSTGVGGNGACAAV